MKSKVLIFLLVVAVMAAWAKGGSQSSPPSSEKAPKTAITIMIDKDDAMEGIQPVLDAAALKFGVEFEIELRTGDSFLRTRLATGDMVDIFMYNAGSLLQAINPERNVVDLTDEPWMAAVTDSFKTAASSNGRVYGVPSGTVMTGGLFYNKRVYRELGLSVPHTWKDFLANCDKIQAAGKTAIIGAYKDTWTSQFIMLADEYNVKAAYPNFPADYTANKAKFATVPAALRSFEKLAETHKYLNTDFLATNYDVALEMLASGEGVHWPIASIISAVATHYPQVVNDIGVFGIPGDDPNNHGITTWEPASFYIYKNSPNIEICKKILEFFISQEGISISASKVKPDGPYAVKGINLPGDVYPGVLDMQAYFNAGKTAPALEFESPVKGPNLEQICVEVGSGITEARAGAIAYDQDVQKQAVQLNLPGW